MKFVELNIGDIFLSWYDDTMYMKIPLCKQDNEVYNAICMFGRNRGQLTYFEPSRGVALCDRVDKDI